MNEHNVTFLVDEQTLSLTRKYQQLKSQLNQLIARSHHSEKIARAIHILSIRCIASSSLDQVRVLLDQEIAKLFDLDFCTYQVWHPLCVHWQNFNKDLHTIKNLETISKPKCAQIHQWPQKFLHYISSHHQTLESLALVPLLTGERIPFGTLFLASKSPDQFSEEQDTFFLVQLSEIISIAIHRFECQS